MKVDLSVLQPLPSDQEASGRSLGPAELALLQEAIASGTLTSTRGRLVRRLEDAFAASLGLPHAVASASGSAAMHAAIAALDLEPGDEVVTTPVTDMGAIAPLLYQGVIPVFADVDPVTCNVTAATLEARLGERTRALVVTHLFGNPCEMEAILALAQRRGLAVIEDCAQAFGAMEGARPVGSLGAIGIFSLQQGKHITCGEGGLAVTRDAALARRMRTFVNKAWDYGEAQPDHRSLALNYRMTELQAAVALPQLERLDAFVAVRRERAAQLTDALARLPGLRGPQPRDGSVHSFWRYVLRVDPGVHAGGAVALGARLAARGISSAPRYIRKPAFECEVFTQQRTFGSSRWPFTLARPEALDWRRERFPGVYAALADMVVLPWNERLTQAHVAHLAAAIAASLAEMGSQ